MARKSGGGSVSFSGVFKVPLRLELQQIPKLDKI